MLSLKMSTETSVQFVVCVRNDGSSDLELRKLYRIMPDDLAAEDEYLRVIDGSGEDFLYPAAYFIKIVVPE